MPDSTTDPFRILIGAETFPPDVNGAAHFARDLAARLSRRGHTVHVVAPATSLSAETRVELCDGERIVVHRLRGVRWPLRDWLRFAPPRNVRDVIEFSGLPRTLHPALTRFGWNPTSHALQRADLVTSPTPFAARYVEQHTTIETVVSVSCGIDLNRYHYSDKRPPGNRVLCVGRLGPEKKLDTLLGAIALIPRQLPIQLDIGDDGSRRRALQRLTENLAITDRVVFHGRVDDRQLIELHRAATVFAMPSTAEPQSIASLEAMACGTPWSSLAQWPCPTSSTRAATATSSNPRTSVTSRMQSRPCSPSRPRPTARCGGTPVTTRSSTTQTASPPATSSSTDWPASSGKSR